MHVLQVININVQRPDPSYDNHKNYIDKTTCE